MNIIVVFVGTCCFIISGAILCDIPECSTCVTYTNSSIPCAWNLKTKTCTESNGSTRSGDFVFDNLDCDSVCWLFSFSCNSTAWIITGVNLTLFLFFLLVVLFALTLEYKDSFRTSVDQDFPFLSSDTVETEANEESFRYVFIVVMCLPCSLIFSFGIPLVAFITNAYGLFFVILLIYDIHSHWGLTKAFSIICHPTPAQDVANEILNCDNPFKTPCCRSLSIIAQKIGKEQEVIYKSVNKTTLQCLRAGLANTVPLLICFCGTSSMILRMSVVRLIGFSISMALLVPVMLLLYLIISRFSTQVLILTKTHWVSFYIGLSFGGIFTPTCIQLNEVEKIELKTTHILFELTYPKSVLTLVDKPLNKEKAAGIIDNLPLFYKSMMTLHFEEVPNVHTGACCSPHELKITGICVYALSVLGLIICMFWDGIAFIIIRPLFATIPINWNIMFMLWRSMFGEKCGFSDTVVYTRETNTYTE